MTSVNLLGVAEHPVLGESPYRVDRDGVPYVPVGDGGVVLGLQLGDSVFGLRADHAAPGVCLIHPDQAARHALTAFACIGNTVRVRSGAADGAVGKVVGKRGEEGRVIVALPEDRLGQVRPGDQMLVRAVGQGLRPPQLPRDVMVLNLDPAVLADLPVDMAGDSGIAVGVRAVLPGKVAGNGIGRPSVSWDLDLQIGQEPPAAELRTAVPVLGDLIAVTDIDARYNMGYRRGWITVGVLVHGGSPLPGHGPGLTPILTGPASSIDAEPDPAGHVGLTLESLQLQ